MKIKMNTSNQDKDEDKTRRYRKGKIIPHKCGFVGRGGGSRGRSRREKPQLKPTVKKINVDLEKIYTGHMKSVIIDTFVKTIFINKKSTLFKFILFLQFTLLLKKY